MTKHLSLKAVVLLTALLSSCRVMAPVPPTPVHDQWVCKPDVISALRQAWIESGEGYTGVEAGFRIDANIDRPYRASYKIVPHEFTNEQGSLTTSIVPWTLAEFHVHPADSGAAPSTPENNYYGDENHGDTLVADENKIDIYTFNTRGLYVYRWETKQIILLRANSEWQKPCK
jgi:hypothetical protein